MALFKNPFKLDRVSFFTPESLFSHFWATFFFSRFRGFWEVRVTLTDALQGDLFLGGVLRGLCGMLLGWDFLGVNSPALILSKNSGVVLAKIG